MSGLGPMRAITVRQPWAWAIVHGGKDVENRSRNIVGDYRGRVAIHAGLAWSKQGAHDANVAEAYFDARRRQGWEVADRAAAVRDVVKNGIGGREFLRPEQYGAIIGTANLWAVHRAAPGCCPNRRSEPFGSPWAMADHWHLCLRDPQPLAYPIPAKGRLGLWTFGGAE